MNIPNSYHTITPYFTVTDADELLGFLTNVFQGIVIKETRYADGKIQHARVLIGDSILMLNESTEIYPANVSQMHIYVDDVNAIFERAISAGATSIMEPNIQPHGDWMAGITDPCGNVWWLAYPI